MAERRMFAKSIVQSSRFLKMPVSSRELFFQMGMSADDDGVVEAWNVMRITNAREDDLRVLVSKGYVQILDNEDLIAYLSDWEVNNTIRKDRYHEGIYKNLKIQMLELNDNQVTTKWQPSDNQVTTEIRLDKDSIGEDNNPPISPQEGKRKRKKKDFVAPTLEEVEEYANKRGNIVDAKEFYDYFDTGDWIDSKGNPVLNWKQKYITWETKRKEQTKKNDRHGQSYDIKARIDEWSKA